MGDEAADSQLRQSGEPRPCLRSRADYCAVGRNARLASGLAEGRDDSPDSRAESIGPGQGAGEGQGVGKSDGRGEPVAKLRGLHRSGVVRGVDGDAGPRALCLPAGQCVGSAGARILDAGGPLDPDGSGGLEKTQMDRVFPDPQNAGHLPVEPPVCLSDSLSDFWPPVVSFCPPAASPLVALG